MNLDKFNEKRKIICAFTESLYREVIRLGHNKTIISKNIPYASAKKTGRSGNFCIVNLIKLKEAIPELDFNKILNDVLDKDKFLELSKKADNLNISESISGKNKHKVIKITLINKK